MQSQKVIKDNIRIVRNQGLTVTRFWLLSLKKNYDKPAFVHLNFDLKKRYTNNNRLLNKFSVKKCRSNMQLLNFHE